MYAEFLCRRFIQRTASKNVDEKVAIRIVLLSESRCPGVYQAGRQRLHCLHGINGIVSTKQSGYFRVVVFFCMVHVSDKLQRVPSAPYGASKAGVRNMVHTLAMEWAQYNIRVNSVSPGLVNTAMTYWVPQQPDWEQQLKYYGGFPRLAEVEELGGAYVYLLSDAASYTTSIDIPVNGVIGIC
jgi:NAD(P)-dependent dehydrogenase (short-subunit alcohol dehydrogenase family)